MFITFLFCFQATVTNGTGDGSGEGPNANLNNSASSEHDPHFEPIITLPEVVIATLEEDEEEMIKLCVYLLYKLFICLFFCCIFNLISFLLFIIRRAKLYRFDSSETPSEWKDRGIGEVKLLRHRTKNTVRVVMRRDKTLKICANHFGECSSSFDWFLVYRYIMYHFFFFQHFSNTLDGTYS